jgi:hypothetical protein
MHEYYRLAVNVCHITILAKKGWYMDVSRSEKKGLSAHMLLIYLLLFDIIVTVVAIAIGIHAGNPLRYFEEGLFITWISALQLFAISWLAFTTLNTRRSKAGRLHWRDPLFIWALISIGFLFLALDDLFMIHESLDKKIHHFFNMKETGFSDRIDDFIIGLYGIFGISILYAYREEMKNYRQILPYLAYGFALLFTMVALDALTNRRDILSFLIEQRDLVKSVYIGLSILEDSFKLLAESCFLVGFYSVTLIAKKISGTAID